MKDTFDLERFVSAQDKNFDIRGSTFSLAYRELRHGRKENHWMWFIFPQIRGLGQSETSIKYAISGRDEACAYLDHSVLGFRLRECTFVVNQDEKNAVAIFGQTDAMKFHSSMTLFAIVSNEPCFREALQKFFNNIEDKNTLDILYR